MGLFKNVNIGEAALTQPIADWINKFYWVSGKDENGDPYKLEFVYSEVYKKFLVNFAGTVQPRSWWGINGDEFPWSLSNEKFVWGYVHEFRCENISSIHSLEGFPIKCDNIYFIRMYGLNGLKYLPKRCKRLAIEGCNDLFSIEGCPKMVDDMFELKSNRYIYDLKGGPEEVGTYVIEDMDGGKDFDFKGIAKKIGYLDIRSSIFSHTEGPLLHGPMGVWDMTEWRNLWIKIKLFFMGCKYKKITIDKNTLVLY